MTAGSARKRSMYATARKRRGVAALPGNPRRIAMKSAQISTSTSEIMNSWMFSQKPLRMLGQLSEITSQLKKTFRRAPSFRKMLSTARGRTTRSARCRRSSRTTARARSPWARASRMLPSCTCRLALTPWTIPGIAVGKNSTIEQHARQQVGADVWAAAAAGPSAGCRSTQSPERCSSRAPLPREPSATG